MPADASEPCFHRTIAISTVGPNGEAFAIEATPAERVSIAHWLGILAVNSVRADGVIAVQSGGSQATLDGRMRAEIVQACVVTLEPVTTFIDAPLHRSFSAALDSEWRQYGNDRKEIFLDLEEGGEIDPLSSAGVDVGMVIAEQLSLEMDPFPRAEWNDDDVASFSAEDGTVRPFAGLKSKLARR